MKSKDSLAISKPRDPTTLDEWIIVADTNGCIEAASSGLANFLSEGEAREFAKKCDKRFFHVAPHRVVRVRAVEILAEKDSHESDADETARPEHNFKK